MGRPTKSRVIGRPTGASNRRYFVRRKLVMGETWGSWWPCSSSRAREIMNKGPIIGDIRYEVKSVKLEDLPDA